MAHFAELDESNIVKRVLVVNNADITDENGDEQESIGIALLKKLFGADTVWVQTSYNRNFRKHFGGKGDFYDATKEKFIPSCPYPSWSLDENDDWQAPVAFNEGTAMDGVSYYWDEERQIWVAHS
tara:strand:- start:421 stop:795 length:375 start_codon:yes stop_codon:yes gene_type:complete